MWTWDQSSGKIFHDGVLISSGYSGAKRGINNPKMQDVPQVGPVPQGMWRITERYDSANVGPYAIKLEPEPGTNTFGRSAFRIHGDNKFGNRTASHGCIILPRDVRTKIWQSGDRLLKVVE